MDYRQLIDSLSPELYQRLQRAVELGRWPDGRPLTPEQREHALQAIIAWGEQHLQESERVGYIDRGHKAGARCDDPAELPLKWKA
jgi:uncharacterized protein YeaC (DUF1315 family)